MKTCNNCTHCDIKFALCKLDYKVRPALGEAVGKGLADSMEEYAYQGVRGIVSSAQKWVSEMYGNPIRAQGMDYSKVSKTNHIEVTQNFNVPVRSHYKTKLEAIQGFAELTRGL